MRRVQGVRCSRQQGGRFGRRGEQRKPRRPSQRLANSAVAVILVSGAARGGRCWLGGGLKRGRRRRRRPAAAAAAAEQAEADGREGEGQHTDGSHDSVTVQYLPQTSTAKASGWQVREPSVILG